MDLEKTLQKYALTPTCQTPTFAPINKIINPQNLDPLSNGTFFRASRLRNSRWVVKEGRWDKDIPLWRDYKLPLPANLLNNSLSWFDVSIHPTPYEITRQFKQYLQLASYYGYSKSTYFLTNFNSLTEDQRHLRNNLLHFLPEISAHYKLSLTKKLTAVLTSKYKQENFLPKEYTLYGKSLSPSGKDQPTAFIFQEYIAGSPLRDLSTKGISDPLRYRLIIFNYLTLLLHHQQGLVPDTRPRYLLLEPYDWLTRTDNIMVHNDKITLIDTRWAWEAKTNIVKRGVFIPELTIKSTCSYLHELLAGV